jgi:uncharacterized membrane protein YkvA (DUF1232 family)
LACPGIPARPQIITLQPGSVKVVGRFWVAKPTDRMGWFLALIPGAAVNRLDNGDAASNDSAKSLIGHARMAGTLKSWARSITRDVHALYLASTDPRVPWYAKLLAVAVAGYALSPIDLIPDFIPILGYLDDLIIVPLGVLAVIRLIPPEVMADHRATAAAQQRPVSRKAAIAIMCIWIVSIAAASWLAYRFFALDDVPHLH